MTVRDSRLRVTTDKVLDALRCGEGEEHIKAMTVREVAVAMLGFDPQNRLPKGTKVSGYSEFTQYLSVSALRRMLNTLVGSGEVVLLENPGLRPAVPPSVRERIEAETERARGQRRNKHQRLDRRSIQATPEEKALMQEEGERWVAAKKRLSKVSFTGPAGYVVAETLRLMDKDAEVLSQFVEAQRIKDQARQEVMDRYRERIARDTERLTSRRLREAGLPPAERFREAGVRLF